MPPPPTLLLVVKVICDVNCTTLNGTYIYYSNYFDTKKCVKSLSPVLAQYTCAIAVMCWIQHVWLILLCVDLTHAFVLFKGVQPPTKRQRQRKQIYINTTALKFIANVLHSVTPRASCWVSTPLPCWNSYSQVQGLRSGMASQERSKHPQNHSSFLDQGRV